MTKKHGRISRDDNYSFKQTRHVYGVRWLGKDGSARHNVGRHSVRAEPFLLASPLL